jgi:hypothetical protein
MERKTASMNAVTVIDDRSVRPFRVDAPQEKIHPNLVYFNKVDRGEHVAAWEEPQLFSEEIRAAFRSLR